VQARGLYLRDGGGESRPDLRGRALVEHHGAHARAHLWGVRQGHRGAGIAMVLPY
jgi:hypothetical protein